MAEKIRIRGVSDFERSDRDRTGCAVWRSVNLLLDTSYDNGLGRHAGDWSEADLQEFEANTAMFQEVDEELWR